MNKKEFLNKLDEILNESKQFKGNFQVQTELFDKLQDVADVFGFDTFMQEYRTENDLFYGSDLFDLTLDNIQTSKFLDFSTIVENADVLNQFGQHQELMELWAVIDVYYNVTAVDFDEIDSAVDALKFELNENY